MSLSSYTFIKKIGQGSYGEVWLVDDQAKKKCVLKKISVLNASEKEKKAAHSECILLKQLFHPNIVQYRDSFEEGGTLYIAMAFCECGDLYTKLKDRKGISLSEKQITEWFIQIVMALSYIHERNILHRDLKTQNIFLAKSSVIKVGDFGIAKQLDNKNAMAMTLIGTPYYMSPELFNKKPYNFKSDIWSLGCITYEMATLKHAFNAKNYNALSYKIIMGQMPSMPSIYSKELIGLIESMLSNKPDKRPSTNKILKEPYIQQHIRNFLDNTKRSKKGESPARGQPIIYKPRKDSCDSKSRSNGGSPFKNSPEILKGRHLMDNKGIPRRSHQSPEKSAKERDNDHDDDSDVVCQHMSRHSSKNSYSFDGKVHRRSSQTVLEKEMAKIDIAADLKPPSAVISAPVYMKHSVSSPQMNKKENKADSDSEQNSAQIKEKGNARNRRREKNRNQGLQTMFFSSNNQAVNDSNNEDQSEKCVSADEIKANRRRGRRRNSENEQEVVLPELKKKPIIETLNDSNENARAELINLVEKMHETLSFTGKQKFSDVKDSLLLAGYCYDDVVENPDEDGPREECFETLQRTKMVSKRYPEIRKEIMKSIGYKKLAAGYEILSDMKIDHEVLLKNLLGEEDYEKYSGKIVWLKMVEDGLL